MKDLGLYLCTSILLFDGAERRNVMNCFVDFIKEEDAITVVEIILIVVGICTI